MAAGSGNWMAFVAAAIAVVGGTGIFATYATPLPLRRALARDATLDRVLALAGTPDAEREMAALRDRLGESADAVLSGADPLPVRVARARTAMHERLLAEADAEAVRMRALIAGFTIMAALFAAAVLRLSR